MFMQIGDLIQVILSATYLGQVLTNIFWYEMSGSPAGLYSLDSFATIFRGIVLAEINPLQSIAVVNKDLKLVVANRDPYPFHIEPLTGGGSMGGEASASYNALGFKLNVATRQTKAGGKRFGGVSEALFNGNDIATSSYSSGLEDLRQALSASLEVPDAGGIEGNAILTPMVVRRGTFLGVPTFVSQPVTSVTLNKFVTTQNTRKQRGE